VASGGTSVPPVQYVWSPVYVDALVLRDRDSNGDGTLDQRLYVMQDANYNITAIFDNAGTIVERYVYDPFGQVTVLATDWSERAASDFAWHYLHQGGRFDATSGLYHFRHRDYSPTLGRWTSLDPIRYEAGDVNLYRYVGNTPTVFTDPSGLDKFWLFDGKVKGPLYLLPGGENIWSDAWSLVFPKRSREYLKSPLHQNFNPNQTNRPSLKAGDIIDRDTRDWHNQAVQGLKRTLTEAGIQAGMAVVGWGAGSFATPEESLRWHFQKHGAEVGAKTIEEYRRKAVEAMKARKGRGTPVPGHTSNVRRFDVHGTNRYVDVDVDTGTVISYGRKER